MEELELVRAFEERQMSFWRAFMEKSSGSSPDPQVIEYGSSPESGSDGTYGAQNTGGEGSEGHG